VARMPSSALSLSQHPDEDASANAQREALKNAPAEFAPGVAKLILRASLYDSNNGPKHFTAATHALALKTIPSEIRPLSLPVTCVAPFRPRVPNYCANTRPPRCRCLPKTD
jgi:hypothetical protein